MTSRLSNVLFMDYIIKKFNDLNNVPFLDAVIEGIEKPYFDKTDTTYTKRKKFSPRQKNVLSEKDNKILNVLKDFFEEQKYYGKKHLRKVFSILSDKIDNVYFVNYANHAFWKLESNLGVLILELIRENNYYLAFSLDKNYVYLIPNDFNFTEKFPNIYEKMHY